MLIDRDPGQRRQGKAHAKSVIDDLVKKGRAKESDRDAILSRITATPDYDAIRDCDLVIEAVFEDRKVKAETYAKAQPLLKPGAIFASNTSTLPINSLAEEFKDQSKFIGIHFFSPVEKMMLVEVISATTPATRRSPPRSISCARSARRRLSSMTPRLLRQPLRAALTAEGLEMLMEGVPPAMIENTARMAGMPVGPLSLSDEVALDLVLKIMKATEADLGANAVDQRRRNDDRDGRETRPLRPQERQGLLRLSGEGQGPEEPVGRHLRVAAEASRSRHARCRGVEAALPGGAGGRGPRARWKTASSSTRARPMSARSWVSASRRSPAARCPISISWAPKTFVDCATSSRPNTARASPRRKLLEEMAAKGETFYGRFPPKKQPAAA